MSGFQSAPRAYEALAAGNVALMKIRFGEHYAATFEKYRGLLERRRALMSGPRTEETELLLHALNGRIEEYASELERQTREQRDAGAYLSSLLGGQDAKN